jgi:uncharacterized membrane protein
MGLGWRIAAAAAAISAYALLSHWLMVHAADRPWAVAVLFGPLVAVVGGAGWQRRQPWVLGAFALAVAGLAGVVATGGVDDINRLYVLQHAGVHLALAASFGLTLRPGSKPLITAMAETVHLQVTPAMRAYTRRLTGLWTAYFIAMVALSGTLYAFAPWPWWSLYANVLTPLSAALLFVGEHAVRYLRHPDFERVSLGTAITAYRRAHAAAEGSST